MPCTARSEVLAGVGRIIMPTGCQTCGWLAVRSGARPAIRIDVNMKAMIAGRQISKVGHDHQALVRIGKADGANDFADATGIDHIHGNGLGVGCTRADDNHRSRKHCNVGSHQILQLKLGRLVRSFCRARTASGIATAPPIRVMNFRRRMSAPERAA